MSWLIPALLSPMFFAAVNHIDKQLLSRYFQGGGAGSLVIFSSMIGVPVALLIWLFGTPVREISQQDMLMLVLNGCLYMASILPYFYAMAKDETSVVAPLFQMISPISYILGVYFLGEEVELVTLLGGVFVFFGAVILSLDLGVSVQKMKFKKNIFLLMLLSSTLTAINGLLFKVASVGTTSFWVSAFWEYIGVVCFGMLTLIFITTYRSQFLEILRENKLGILSTNAVNEVCAVIAKLLLHYASLLAPLAIVFWIGEGFQPFFVFLYGLILSILFPRLVSENLERRFIFQKISAICLMLVGTYILAG